MFRKSSSALPIGVTGFDDSGANKQARACALRQSMFRLTVTVCLQHIKKTVCLQHIKGMMCATVYVGQN